MVIYITILSQLIILMGSCCSKDIVSPKTGLTIADIKNKIQPLDLIFFRGADVVSNTISLAEKYDVGQGSWTHVGMVITPDIVPIKNSKPDGIYVWESTMSGYLGDGVNNIETGSWTFGVQIRDLADVVDKYDNNSNTRIGWSQLNNNPLVKKDGESDDEYKTRKNKISKILTDFKAKFGNATYDYNCCDLCSGLCPKELNYPDKFFGSSDEKYFCSELVAKIYQLIDVIKKNVKPVNILPEELLGFGDNELNKIVSNPQFVTRVW